MGSDCSNEKSILRIYADEVSEVGVKLEVEGVWMNVVSTYAPQVRYEMDGKDFWSVR